MTVKQFLKSKTFRCILVLLCIALVSGGLLAIMNDLLYVSESERVSRTVKSIYGQEMEYKVVDVPSSFNGEGKGSVGRIDNVYLLSDGNYLIKATGSKGYKEGSISIWCVAKFDGGAFVALDNVSIAEYEKQTLMSKFTKDVLSRYKGAEETVVTVSGATYSATAAKNAFNTALSYVKTELEGGKQ